MDIKNPTRGKMKTAVIFDMDGVISDTQKLHTAVEIKILKRFGIYMTSEEISQKYAGVSDDVMFAEIFRKHKIKPKDISKVISEKWRIMEKLPRGRIKAIPYSLDLVNSLKKSGFKLGITSASTTKFITDVLKSLGIFDKFDAIVSASEVKSGKPAPDIFLLAAKRLSIKPSEAIVIEDGKSGMIGAIRAGMKCIGLVNDLKKKYPASKLVTTLKQISINDLYHI